MGLFQGIIEIRTPNVTLPYPTCKALPDFFNLFCSYKAKCDGRAFRVGFIFTPIMPSHVLSPYYASYEHTRGIKGYVTYYLT